MYQNEFGDAMLALLHWSSFIGDNSLSHIQMASHPACCGQLVIFQFIKPVIADAMVCILSLDRHFKKTGWARTSAAKPMVQIIRGIISPHHQIHPGQEVV
jgi:hypothetical protein